MGKLEGKVAMITGGAGGLGETTARLMIEEGAKVIIADILDEPGNALVAELNKNGTVAHYVHVDVTNEEQVIAGIDEGVKAFGKLDLLFNNAGMSRAADVTEIEKRHWDLQLNINLTGIFLVGKYAIIQMLKNGGGAIVNTASISGMAGSAGLTAYCATKGGVIGITRAVAIDMAQKGIRVNSISPGYVDTPILAKMDPQAKKDLENLHPMGRVGKPIEIAKVVVFMLSDDASFMTGANVAVDGGYTAW